jgi:hypothetical protein
MQYFEVSGQSNQIEDDLYFPEIIKQGVGGDFYVLDEGYKSPIVRFGEKFNFIDSSGVRGNGPLQIEGFRDVILPTPGNDTTYLVDMYGRKILCYDENIV